MSQIDYTLYVLYFFFFLYKLTCILAPSEAQCKVLGPFKSNVPVPPQVVTGVAHAAVDTRRQWSPAGQSHRLVGVEEAEAEPMRDKQTCRIPNPESVFDWLCAERPDQDVLHLNPRQVRIHVEHQRDDTSYHRTRRQRSCEYLSAGLVFH